MFEFEGSVESTLVKGPETFLGRDAAYQDAFLTQNTLHPASRPGNGVSPDAQGRIALP